MRTHSSENCSNELAFIKSAGYDEVPSSVLLDTIAKLDVNWLISDATAAGVPACLT